MTIDRHDRRAQTLRTTIALAVALAASACKSAPLPPPVVVPVSSLSFEADYRVVQPLTSEAHQIHEVVFGLGGTL